MTPQHLRSLGDELFVGVWARLQREERLRLGGEFALRAACLCGTPPPEILLDGVRAFLARFVAFPDEHSLVTATLWAAHAHMIEEFYTTPRLAVLSPEPESGKSRLLEILALLTPNAMLVLSPSVAAIFRKLAGEQITLLFDECDTIFTRYGKDDQNEDLRALLNAGYRRGAAIPRCVGPHHDVKDFPVFAATALAGIGDLPQTVITRSIVIPMRRRSTDEPVEQFRTRANEPEGHALRDMLAEWAGEVGEDVGAAYPHLPAGVIDRKAEAWEPLIAVADAAGGTWPERARAAAVSYVSLVSLSMGVSASLGVRLLADLRRVLGDQDAMFTKDILEALNGIEEAPWGGLKAGPLDSRGLAGRLKAYRIFPEQVRVGDRTLKGYRREWFFDAWKRYLPSDEPLSGETRETASSPTPTKKETRETNTGSLFERALPLGGETRETSETCPRCAGEGCRWCDPANLGVAHA